MKFIIILMMGSFIGAFAQDLTRDQQAIIDLVENGARNRAQIVSQYASSNISLDELLASSSLMIQAIKSDEFNDPQYSVKSVIRKVYEGNQRRILPVYLKELAALNKCREKRGKLLIAPSIIVKEYSKTNENGEILTADFMQFPSLELDDLAAQYIDQVYNTNLILSLIESTSELKLSCLKVLKANESRVVIQSQDDIAIDKSNEAIQN